MNIVNIRASSLSELFDCPARWEAKNLLNMRNPSSAASHLGTAIHAGTAAYDESRLEGGNPITADEAAGVLVDALHDKEAEVVWDDVKPSDAEKIGLVLHTRYCSTIAPAQNYTCVELEFSKLEITDLGISLTGTTDRVRMLPDGSMGIVDLKSGARSVGSDGKAVTQGHAPQLGVYTLLAEHSLGQTLNAPAQIVGLQTGKTPASQRVGTGEVANVKSTLIGDEETPGLLQHASNVIQNGSFYGNPKSMLCSAKYCPRHHVCKFKS